MSNGQQIAETTLTQLGGRLALRMIGANQVGFECDGKLTIRFAAKARNGSNVVTIAPDPSDTYTVEFFSVRGTSVRQVESFSSVYSDSLRELFTTETGLYLSF